MFLVDGFGTLFSRLTTYTTYPIQLRCLLNSNHMTDCGGSPKLSGQSERNSAFQRLRRETLGVISLNWTNKLCWKPSARMRERHTILIHHFWMLYKGQMVVFKGKDFFFIYRKQHPVRHEWIKHPVLAESSCNLPSFKVHLLPSTVASPPLNSHSAFPTLGMLSLKGPGHNSLTV